MRHSAPLTTGARGVLHGAMSAVLQDEEGQILEAHSISAGLDYPGVGPEHAWLRDSGRVRYEAVDDGAALAAFRRVAELEGILPALESSHAVAWVLANPGNGPRPDHAVRPRRQGPRRGARARGRLVSVATTGTRPDRRRLRGARQARRDDALPDGRLPRPRGLGRGGPRRRGRRRRPDRARRAVLRPARRRARDPRGRDRGARRSASRCTGCSGCASRSPPGCRSC